MTRNIQHWMIIDGYKFLPESDVKKHPTMDDYDIVYKFHPGTDDKKHPIMEKKLLHPILDDKNHPLLDDYR